MPAILRPFDAETEARFQLHYAERSIPFIRVSLPIAITLYLFFLFWDYAIDASQLGMTIGVRLAFSVLLLAIFGLTFVDGFERWAQRILCAIVIVGAAGVLLVLHLLPEGFTYGLGGVLLVIMFACGFIRLLFRQALVACVAILATANGFLLVHGSAPFDYFNANFFLVSASIIGLSYTALLEWMDRRAFHFEEALREEKRATDRVLRNFIPDRIADRLRGGEKNIAEAVGEGTVLFADLVGFTSLTQRLAPGHLVEILSDIFNTLDNIAERKGIEKVKTIGDNYMVVGGVQNPSPKSAEAVAEFALEALDAITEYAENKELPLQFRIGMATGSLVSGVIGTKVPIFDLWGETVNLASRLESEGAPGTIQVSESTYWRLHQSFEFEERGLVRFKGDIEVMAYQLNGRKPALPSVAKNLADAGSDRLVRLDSLSRRRFELRLPDESFA